PGPTPRGRALHRRLHLPRCLPRRARWRASLPPRLQSRLTRRRPLRRGTGTRRAARDLQAIRGRDLQAVYRSPRVGVGPARPRRRACRNQKGSQMNKGYGQDDPRMADYAQRVFLTGDEAELFADVRARQAAAGMPDIAIGLMDGLHLEVIT